MVVEVSTTAQLLELVGFLHDKSPQVREIALQNLLGYTARSNPNRHIFLTNDRRPIKDLCLLCRNHPLIAHDALKALTNLSQDDQVVHDLDQSEFIEFLVQTITSPDNVLADPACMLLSNMTKTKSIALKLLSQNLPDKYNLGSTKAMDQLVTVFVRGMDKKYNPNADYAFMGSIFANVSMLEPGRMFFMEPAQFDNLVPITKLIVFTEHSSIIRRGGVISTVKNCCFGVAYHDQLLAEDQVNILPYLLLPLAGPETLDEDDMDGMPDELQLLPDDKKRELDGHLRRTLVETIVLLGSKRPGREFMRAKKVYPIIRELHKWENNEDVQIACERVVDLLMNDEGPENDEHIQEIESSIKPNAGEDSDDKIEEVKI